MTITKEAITQSKKDRLARYDKYSTDMTKTWQERKQYSRMASRLYDELNKN